MSGFYSKDKGSKEPPAHRPVCNTDVLLRTHVTRGQGVKLKIFIIQKEICDRNLEHT